MLLGFGAVENHDSRKMKKKKKSDDLRYSTMFLLQIYNGSTKNQNYYRGNQDKGNGRKRNEVMRRNEKRKEKKKATTNASGFDRLALFPSGPSFLNYLPFCRQKTRECMVSERTLDIKLPERQCLQTDSD